MRHYANLMTLSILKRSLAALALLVVLFVSAAPLTVLAQRTPPDSPDTSTGSNCGSSDGLVNPLKGVCSFEEFLSAILAGVVQIGTIILIMMLVYVGFLFVAARGNAEKIQGARSALVWTVIGGLILLGATSIQLVIQGTVNSLQ